MKKSFRDMDFFLIGEWSVEPRRLLLTRDDRSVRVEPKIMEVLVLLARRAQRVVTREELLDSAWKGVVVGDEALTRAVSELRRALGDDARRPAYIETIPKIGYRLKVPAEPIQPVRPATPGTPVDDQRGLGRPNRSFHPVRFASAMLFLLVAVLLVVGYSRFEARESRRSAFRSERPLTTTPGMEIDPAVSPDGSRVAFARLAPGSSTLRIAVNFMEEERTTLPVEDSVSTSDRLPAWSPDGTLLAFIRGEGPGCGIRLVASTGGRSRGILPCTAHFRPSGVQFTADGMSLLYTSRRAGSRGGRLGSISLADGSNRILYESRTASFREPHMFPRSRGVVFIEETGPGISEVQLLSGDGRHPRPLTHLKRSLNGLTVRPDDETLVLTSYHGTHFEVWQTSDDGGDARLIDTGLGSISHPSIARRGKTAAYVRWDFDTGIEQTPVRDDSATGSPWPSGVLNSTWRDYMPAVSPDGMQMAFVSERSGTPELWVIDAGADRASRLTKPSYESDDGSAAGALAGSGYFSGSPAWAPDGSAVVFSKMDMQRGQSDLFIVDVRDGWMRRLTQDTSNEAAPFFDRGGRSVLAASDRDGAWRLWRFPLDSGVAPMPVGSIDVRFGKRNPSGDGYYVTSPDSAGVWQLSAAGEIERFLPLPMYGAEDGGNWTVSDQGILFIHRTPDGVSSIGVYDFASGGLTFRPAAGIVKRNSGLTLSGDGSVVLYTTENRRESDLVIADIRDN